MMQVIGFDPQTDQLAEQFSQNIDLIIHAFQQNSLAQKSYARLGQSADDDTPGNAARSSLQEEAQRDLLESYLAKYREATTRENIEAAPADGRIISRASVSNVPA